MGFMAKWPEVMKKGGDLIQGSREDVKYLDLWIDRLGIMWFKEGYKNYCKSHPGGDTLPLLSVYAENFASLWSKINFASVSVCEFTKFSFQFWQKRTRFPISLWVIKEDHGIRSHHFMGNRWGNSGNSVRLFLGGLQNHCRWWLQPWN